MRAYLRLLTVAFSAAFLFGASAANADVYVWAKTVKNKTLTVDKTVTITKTITLVPTATINLDSTSEQDIVANQRNQYNYAQDELGVATNDIIGSFDDASGEQATIQNNGYNNNNANADSISYSNSPNLSPSEGNFVDAEVNVQQINGDYYASPVVKEAVDVPPWDNGGANRFEVVGGFSYANTIDSSFNGAAGVAKTIQENGSNNNNFNGIAIALGEFAVFTLDENNVGQFNTGNFANVIDGVRANTINASFIGYDGMAATIQDNGANNNNSNTSAMSFSTTNPPGPGLP
jgi:hypothetical protein